MSLEFSQSMYIEMEKFVEKKQFFTRATNVVDSDRLSLPVARHFSYSFSTPRAPSCAGVEMSQPLLALSQPLLGPLTILPIFNSSKGYESLTLRIPPC